MKILFADLDGTLITTRSGETFPVDENDWVLRNEVVNAIQLYGPDRLHIVSNQGGVAAGYVTVEQLHAKLAAIVKDLQASIDCQITYDFCTSTDNNDYNRKPNPGMVVTFIQKHGIKPTDELLMIGDASGSPGDFSDSDFRCACNVSETIHECMYMDVDNFVDILTDKLDY